MNGNPTKSNWPIIMAAPAEKKHETLFSSFLILKPFSNLHPKSKATSDQRKSSWRSRECTQKPRFDSGLPMLPVVFSRLRACPSSKRLIPNSVKCTLWQGLENAKLLSPCLSATQDYGTTMIKTESLELIWLVVKCSWYVIDVTGTSHHANDLNGWYSP